MYHRIFPSIFPTKCAAGPFKGARVALSHSLPFVLWSLAHKYAQALHAGYKIMEPFFY